MGVIKGNFNLPKGIYAVKSNSGLYLSSSQLEKNQIFVGKDYVNDSEDVFAIEFCSKEKIKLMSCSARHSFNTVCCKNTNTLYFGESSPRNGTDHLFTLVPHIHRPNCFAIQNSDGCFLLEKGNAKKKKTAPFGWGSVCLEVQRKLLNRTIPEKYVFEFISLETINKHRKKNNMSQVQCQGSGNYNNSREPIEYVIKHLNSILVGRDIEIKLTLLSLLCKENICFFGPPGTGKSMLAREFSNIIHFGDDSPKYFEVLMTQFTELSELFGPVSISDLRQGQLKRNDLEYLPRAKIGFLDETFKANSAILNVLLTIMNERKYKNPIVQDSPIEMIIGASNEFPDCPSLEALYDRFLFRTWVSYLEDKELGELLLKTESMKTEPVEAKLMLSDIRQELHASKVHLPEFVIKFMLLIRRHDEMQRDWKSISDRRMAKMARALRVVAWTNGRAKVCIADTLIMMYSLWSKDDVDHDKENVFLQRIKTVYIDAFKDFCEETCTQANLVSIRANVTTDIWTSDQLRNWALTYLFVWQQETTNQPDHQCK